MAIHLLEGLILGYGLATTGYLIVRHITGERLNWITFANNFVPWLGLGGLGAAGAALISRRRWLLLAFQLPMLVFFAVHYGVFFLPGGSAAEAHHGFELTVATFNVWAYRSDPDAIARVVDDLDADIIGLQEVWPQHIPALRERLADEYPYRVLFGYSVGLLSRYPIESQEAYFPFRPQRHRHFVVNVNGTRVSIYVEHPAPPQNFASPSSYDQAGHDLQMARVLDRLRSESGPLLVLCDCNMSDQTRLYDMLDGLLDDAFRSAGWGLGLTYPSGGFKNIRLVPPLVRIDYVWVSRHFEARDAWVWKDSGTSDHRPVVARLVLKTGQP